MRDQHWYNQILAKDTKNELGYRSRVSVDDPRVEGPEFDSHMRQKLLPNPRCIEWDYLISSSKQRPTNMS